MPTDIVEMLWKCTHCGATNLGRHKECTDHDGIVGCGKPKSPQCEEWLPDDVSHESAAVVRRSDEPDLFRKFTAGPDWRCRFCGCLEWRVDGSCDNCGAPEAGEEKKQFEELREQSTDSSAPSRASAPAQARTVPRSSNGYDDVLTVSAFVPKQPWYVPAGAVSAVVVTCGLVYAACRTVPHPSTVTATSWKHVIYVDREQVVHRDGWDPPGHAFNVTNNGSRVRSYDHMVDHYETESYTVREACGQSCSPIPRVCTNVPRTCYTTTRSCKSNKNGSATCTGGDKVCSGGGQSCSGGGQSCSTKYCTVLKSRQRPVYRDVPIYHDHYSWDAWEWTARFRSVPASGTDSSPHPPSREELELGEHERVNPEEDLTCVVVFTDDKERIERRYTPRGCNAEFRTLPVGTRKTLLVNSVGSIEISERR